MTWLLNSLIALVQASFCEVDAVGVVLVASLALPGHRRVVQELVEPGADQAVAALDLVIQERQRQRAVERFDPQRQPAELDGQRVEVDSVDAAFDNVAAQNGLGARLEVVVIGPARQRLAGAGSLGVCSS